MWGIVDGGTLTNPINMSEWSNTLAQQTYRLNCSSVGNEIMTVYTSIYCESSKPVVIPLLLLFVHQACYRKYVSENQIISITHIISKQRGRYAK